MADRGRRVHCLCVYKGETCIACVSGKERRALPVCLQGTDVHCLCVYKGQTCIACVSTRDRHALPVCLQGTDVHCLCVYKGQTCIACVSTRDRRALPVCLQGTDVHCLCVYKGETCIACVSRRKRRALPVCPQGRDVCIACVSRRERRALPVCLQGTDVHCLCIQKGETCVACVPRTLPEGAVQSRLKLRLLLCPTLDGDACRPHQSGCPPQMLQVAIKLDPQWYWFWPHVPPQSISKLQPVRQPPQTEQPGEADTTREKWKARREV